MEKKNMVQKEINKKTRIYALVAVLSAIVLVSAIYAVSSPTVTFTAGTVSPLKSFASIVELKDFLAANTNSQSSFSGGPLDAQHNNALGSASPTTAYAPDQYQPI